jgi:hypothetical protein
VHEVKTLVSGGVCRYAVSPSQRPRRSHDVVGLDRLTLFSSIAPARWFALG